MNSPSLAIAAALFAFSVGAQAGVASIPATVTGGGASSKTETKGYAGLNWTLGGGYTPALVLGLSNTKTKSDGDTTGANLALHINLAGGIKPGMFKLSYLNGNNHVQGELGAGFNFITSSPLLFLGAHGPFVAVGVDAYLNPGFVPYATVHTLDRYQRPRGGNPTLSCPNPSFPDLVGSDCFPSGS